MPAKKSQSTKSTPRSSAAASKQSSITIPTSWLIAGALLLAAVVGVKAIGKGVEKVAIDEVRVPKQETTYTGVISRTAANAKEKEKYVITLDNGTKYILIGLKKSYEDKNKNSQTPKKDNESKEKGKPTAKPTPHTTPRADADDINSFEQYVGKKVTIVGMAVPVEKEDELEQKENKGQDQGKNLEKSPRGNKPSMTPKASASPKVSGWDYDRLVVKSIAVVQ